MLTRPNLLRRTLSSFKRFLAFSRYSPEKTVKTGRVLSMSRKNPNPVCLLALFSLGFLAPSAGAEPPVSMPEPGNWRGSISAGLDTDINSGLVDAERWQYRSGGVTSDITVDKTTFNDVYGSTLTTGFEASYAVTRFSEVFGRLSYSTASGDTVTLGKIGNADVKASFDDYKAYGLDVGYRYFFDLDNTGFTPYMGAAAGMRYVPGFGASMKAVGVDLAPLNLFDDSFVPTLGLDIGFLYPFSRDFAVGFETGVYYSFSLKDDDSSFANGNTNSNNNADRLYVPARLKGIWKF